MSIASSVPQGAVLRLLREHLPPEWRQRDLPDQMALGSDGFGLDSIAIVELLIAVEREVGRPISTLLLTEGRITVTALLAYAGRAGA